MTEALTRGDTTAANDPVDSSRLQSGRLGALGISAIVISAVAPVGVLAAATPVIFAVHGAATPATYLLAGALFGLFAVGYVAMSRHMVNAGGFVAYVARALGDRAATATALLTLLFYLAALVSFYAIVGVVAAGTFGLDISPSIVSLVMLAIVGVLGYLGVNVNVKLLVGLLTVEIVSILAVDVALVAQGGPEGYSVSGFEPSTVTGAGFGVALLLCMTSYSGLEATVVFSEEAREPRRTIPRAVYVSLGFVAVFYTITSWLLSVHTGASAVQSAAGENIGGFFFAVVEDAMGSGFTRFLEILVVTSFLALFVGFQTMIARYVFALGRAGVLPAGFGRTSGQHKDPKTASVVVTAGIGAVLLCFILAGADPVTVTYSWLVGLGTVGLLVVLSLVCVSVLTFFARTRTDESAFATRIAPGLALLGLLAVLVLAVKNYTFLGDSDEAARSLLLLIPLAAAIGWVLASVRHKQGKHLDYTASLGG